MFVYSLSKLAPYLYRGLLCVLVIIWLTLTSISCNNETRSSTERIKEPTNDMSLLGALPRYATDPDDNLSSPEKVTLGRFLFFDPILSGNKEVSCATCHLPEFNYADFLETSIGVNGRGAGGKRQFKIPNDIPFVKRNAQSILNTAFNGITNNQPYEVAKAPMFWDLRAKGLEEQALIPIKTLEEMKGHAFTETSIVDEILRRIKTIPEYNRLFSAAFKTTGDPVTAGNLAKTIAAYERTLLANNSRFDQFMRGDRLALTEGEQDGLKIFLKTGCVKCHAGPMLSDFKLHTLGVPDTPNRQESDQGAEDSYAFRTPTLRNLRYSAPYMHSGKFQTLEQVLQFYEDISGGKSPNPHVSPNQIDTLASRMQVNFKDIPRIVEFLNALNDDNFDKTVPQHVPSGLPSKGL